MPLFGSPDVEKLWIKGDVKGLFKALKYKNPRIRRAAALALVNMGYARIVVETLEQSTSPADDVWMLDVLVAILKEWDIIARRTAIQMLVQMGEPAMGLLIAALGGEDARMRQSAATALGQLGEQLGAAALRERIVESLIAALEDKEEDVRRATAKGLGQIGSQLKDTALRVRVTKSLIVALKDNYADEAVCQATAEALDKLDWHPSRSQAGAIYWIAKGQLDKCVEIGPPAVQPLIAAREYMDRDVRRAAAKALDELGWRSDQSVATHFTRLQKTGR